jgi:hypothetical protein
MATLNIESSNDDRVWVSLTRFGEQAITPVLRFCCVFDAFAASLTRLGEQAITPHCIGGVPRCV